MHDGPPPTKPNWERRLDALVPLYGHRNWIVVADSAYPAQSRVGIETTVSGTGHLDVVRKLIETIAACKHVRTNIYLDKELEFVAESDAAGVSAYRTRIAELLKTANPTTLLHEEMIAKLDQIAQIFRVLIIKTNLTIPYSSVLFELDCGYWTAEAEQRLRRAMAAHEPGTDAIALNCN